jgi:succinoglycan biosynthesis transport protein ExoP
MSQTDTPALISYSGPERPARTIGQRLDYISGFIRRRYLSITICILLGLPIGAFYLFATPPSYIASSTILIEGRSNQIQQTLFGDAPPDAAWIESQLVVLKSQSVAAYVVKQLRLADDPEFIRSTGPLGKLLARYGWDVPEPKTDAERFGAAAAALVNQLDVKRVGQSYMMRIDFRSGDPEQATKIANSIIDGYIFDQLNAKYQSNRRAGDWLLERLQALREQSAAAERAVVDFKASNKIISAGGGRLINEQQLSESNDQLAKSRARILDLEARIARIDTVRQAFQQEQRPSDVDETVSDVLSNSIISRLQNQYVDLLNRERDWSTRYGKTHVAVINIQNQIRDIRISIRDELGRVAEAYKSDLEIAKKRQEQLETALAGLMSQSKETNQAQVALFSLEAAAQSYRKLYDSFLQRHTESVQQQSYPISNARAVSSASVYRAGPKAFQVWMMTVLGSLAIGVGLGTLRDVMDRGFRTTEQLRALNFECLALLPRLSSAKTTKALRAAREAPSITLRLTDQINPRTIQTTPGVMRTVVHEPTSLYAEAVSSIDLALGIGRNESSVKTLALTSCLPGEGKSTLAAAMAASLATRGARVLLVDGDLRNPSLSRSLAPKAAVDWFDVVSGKVGLAGAIWRDPVTQMHFLPLTSKPSTRSSADIFNSAPARSFFAALEKHYDHIIVDLAPLIAGAEVRATSSIISSYILVVEWGSTKTDALTYALRNSPEVHEKIIGAVLNKVDFDMLAKYDRYGSQYYYKQADARAS